MTSLLSDLKHSLRLLRKTPGFTLAAIVVLALGIGANTAIFSIVYGVLLRPMPFAEPEQLVQLWHVPPAKSFPGMTRFSLSAANYLDWEKQNTVFAKSAIYSGESLRLTGKGEPQVLQAARVEGTFFSVLGVAPLLGRPLSEADTEPGHGNVVVLSHRMWKTQFGGDPNIVGRELELNGQKYAVIGVMPQSFAKPGWAGLWTPLVWEPTERTVRGEHHWLAIARLKPGVTVARAQAELTAIAVRLAQEYPADNAGWGAVVAPLREETVGDVRKPLLVLLGAVAFVLLIACANVANLMLAKVLERRKEIAIRAALGAHRGDILRQVIGESVLLSVAGGALGLVVAHFGTLGVISYLGSRLPRLHEIGLDSTVLGFTFAMAVLTGVISGAAPAWKLSNSDPNDALKQGLGRTDLSSGGRRTRNALVVVEVALSLVLLVGAGLMIRTLWNLRNVYPGFDSDHVLIMTLGVSSSDYQSEAQQMSFYDEVLRRVRALPGVQSAGVIDSLPLSGDGSTQPIAIEGRPGVAMADQPEVAVRQITPGYFGAVRLPLRRGREITDADTMSAPAVVVISESMAQRFWPHEDPIGKRLTLTFSPDRVREVVGVVGDVKDDGLNVREPNPTLYWPLAQMVRDAKFGKFRSFPMQMAVRTTTDPNSAVTSVRNAVHEISANTPLTDVQTMQDLISESISPQRLNMFLLATFAGLALVLAAVGIYSVLAYSVRQRVHEIGIRMALGATVSDVLRMIMVEGMRPTVLGVAIGAAAAIALGRVLSSLIFGVKATDVATFVSVSLLLLAAGFAASVMPAYRATRVDPINTLRDE